MLIQKKIIILCSFIFAMFELHAQIHDSAAIFEVVNVFPKPLITQGDAGTQNNRYGFEGGRVIKLKETYYIFTTEMSGLPIWGKTRLSAWKSGDGIKWSRVSTIFESSGEFEGMDTHAALWSPMPTFDNEKDRWVLTYVCYRSKPNTDKDWFRNYDGRIALAISSKKGIDGICGPYKELGSVMEPDTLKPWLGLMGVDSFFPYQANGRWMAFYGSSPEWNGLAEAPKLQGPWKRLLTAGVVSEHTENPIVQKLKNNLYVAFFDGCGVYQKFGYLLSVDGIHWSKPIIIDLDKNPDKWWGLSRTPLGFTEEADGTYILFFTAYNKNFYQIPGIWQAKSDTVFDGFFASVGRITLKLISNKPNN